LIPSLVLWGVLGCSEPPTEAPPAADVDADANADGDGDRPPSVRSGPVGPMSFEAVVDATDTASGWLRATVTYRGVAEPLVLKRHGDDGAYEIDSVRWHQGDERRKVRRDGARYELPTDARGDITVSYRFRPGQEGRHGHQGWSDDRFAVFDGRGWLLPISRQPLADARVRFTVPEGWSPATALVPAAEGWWTAEGFSGPILLDRLLKECHGVGPFRRDDLTLGRTQVLSFVHTDLDDALEQRIVDDTRAVWGWFHGTIGFDPGYPMAFVRTPSGRGARVFGGASMVGACYEGRYNDEPDRNTYLLGHRFGHPFNKYPPRGMTPAGPDEHWFTEGWASYAEVVAAESTGRGIDGTYFSHLWEVHQNKSRKEPHFDELRLVDEGRLKGDQVEYAHYFRGPLAVRALAHAVESRSDRTLEDFVRHLASTASDHRRPYHLQAELEDFTGARFGDVWAAWVHGGLPMVPAFPGAIDAWARDRAARPVTARSGEVGVHVDDLRWLAASGRFDTFAGLFEHVGLEGPRRQALRARGVTLVPDEVLASVHGLTPASRDALVRAEAGWPVHLVAEPLPPLAPQLAFTDAPDAAILQALAATEPADRAVTMAGGIDRIAVRVGDKKASEDRPDVLVVAPDQPFTLFVWWREPPSALRIEVLHDDALTWSRDVVGEPGWVRNRLVVGVADRPATPGRLTVRVTTLDGLVLGQRSFWQR
jgi:hypothetical protein